MNKNYSIQYKPSILTKAFQISDNDINKDKYMKIKEKWIDEKTELEFDIREHNKKQKVVRDIKEVKFGDVQLLELAKATITAARVDSG